MRLKKNQLITFLFVLVLSFFACSENPSNVGEFNPYKWQISPANKQGLDSNLLMKAVEKAEDLKFVNSLLIVKNGYLVLEKYYNDYNLYDAHNVQSVAKSFLSALTAIALRENYLETVNQKVINFFPEYDIEQIDARKKYITIQDLLTMKAGYEYDFENYIMYDVFSSSNWIRAAIELPLVNFPGETYNYSTIGTHLLSVIISRATGIPNLKFAENYLFDPMKISVRQWNKDPQGNYIGGFGMYFTPRDMARFGLLYLNNGNLDGKQIVPQKWVKNSIEDYSLKSNWSWGSFEDIGYGYLWWLGRLAEYWVYLALGYGGQFIINIPSADMIVVTTSNWQFDHDTADKHERDIIKLIADFILPAAKY